MRGYFATKTLLFLGYGLADEDFKRLYHEVERHLGKHKRRAYAVQLNPTMLAVKYWQQKNVEVIAADAMVFLEALGRTVGVGSGLSTTESTGSSGSVSHSTVSAGKSASSNPSRKLHDGVLESPIEAENLPLSSNMVVGASATLFAQWLSEYTRDIAFQAFPTEKGRFVLQRIRPPLSVQSPITLTMDSSWVTSGKEDDTESAWQVAPLVTFRVVPLGAEQMELHAECTQPVVSKYFHKLLQEIRWRWVVQETGFADRGQPTKKQVERTIIGMPNPTTPTKDTDMDFERGLNAFRKLAQDQDWDQDFTVHEAALRDNLRDERRYGPSEQTRRDRARIVIS